MKAPILARITDAFLSTIPPQGFSLGLYVTVSRQEPIYPQGWRGWSWRRLRQHGWATPMRTVTIQEIASPLFPVAHRREGTSTIFLGPAEWKKVPIAATFTHMGIHAADSGELIDITPVRMPPVEVGGNVFFSSSIEIS